MPRQPEPDGRRNSVCTKLSNAELAAVELARGGVKMAEWVRLALLAAAERQQQPLAVHGIQIITDERMPPGPAAFISRGRDEVQVVPFSLGADQSEQDAAQCPHPKKDRLKGRCRRCRTFVGFG